MFGIKTAFRQQNFPCAFQLTKLIKLENEHVDKFLGKKKDAGEKKLIRYAKIKK